MYRISIIIIMLFFFCRENREDKGKKEISIKRVEQANKSQEVFDVFFRKFGRDSVFQKERFKDTIKYYTYNDYDKVVVSKYPKGDFYFRDYMKDSLAHREKYNAYSIEKKIEKDSVSYYLWGIDNGIHKFYIFKKNDTNNWYLEAIHDYSN